MSTDSRVVIKPQADLRIALFVSKNLTCQIVTSSLVHVVIRYSFLIGGMRIFCSLVVSSMKINLEIL